MTGLLKRYLRHGSVEAARELLKEWARGGGKIGKDGLLAALAEPELQYWTVKGAIERGEKELLRELLGTQVLSEPVEFDFPTATEKGSPGTVRAIAFKSSKEIKNKQDASLETVKSFLNSEVAVFFEKRNFIGNSFQAPLAYALYCGGIPKGLMLSGSLEADGDFEATDFEKKRKVARREKRFLIWEGNVKELSDYFKKEELNLPFLIRTESSDPPEVSFRALKEASGAETVRGLDWRRLSLTLPQSLPPSDWMEFVERAVEEIRDLTYLPFKFNLHLAIKGPSALAIGIGAALGVGKIPTALYHYVNRTYHKVIDLTDPKKVRNIKDVSGEISLFEFTPQPKGRKKAVLGLEIASHGTKGISLAQELEADFFYAKHKDRGDLPLETEAWEETVAQAYRILNRVYNYKDYEEINLIMSVPVLIALALGMAVGNYWPIKVWQFFSDRNDYLAVLDLKRVKSVDAPQGGL